MTKDKSTLREQIILLLGNALYAGKSLEQISKITKKQLAPFEPAADQIMQLITHHDRTKRQELLELAEIYPEKGIGSIKAVKAVPVEAINNVYKEK